MEQVPRDTRAPLFGWQEIVKASCQGLMVLGCLWLSYLGSAHVGHPLDPQDATRSMVLVTLVVSNAVLIAMNRSSMAGRWRLTGGNNPTAWWVTAAAIGMILLCLYVPLAAEVLQLAALDVQQLLVAVACGLISMPLILLLFYLQNQPLIKDR